MIGARTASKYSSLGMRGGQVAAGDCGDQDSATIQGTTVVDTAAHFFAITWDGSDVKVYLDKLVEYNAAQSSAPVATEDYFFYARNSSGTAGAHLPGTYGDLFMHRTVALDATQLSALYNFCKSRWGLA